MNRVEIIKNINVTEKAKLITKEVEKNKKYLDPNRESKLRAKRRYNRVRAGKCNEVDYKILQEEYLKSKGLI